MIFKVLHVRELRYLVIIFCADLSSCVKFHNGILKNVLSLHSFTEIIAFKSDGLLMRVFKDQDINENYMSFNQ